MFYFGEPEMKRESVAIDQREAAAFSKTLLDLIRAEVSGKDTAMVASCLVLLASTMLMSLGTEAFVKHGTKGNLPSDMTQDGLDAILACMGNAVDQWENRN